MSPNSILSSIFPYVDEEQWHDGINLYNTSKIKQILNIDNFVVFETQELGTNNEVRIKIHPNKTYIQWIECTCSLNKIKHQSCKHIIAALMMLEQNNEKNLVQMDPQIINKIAATAKKTKKIIQTQNKTPTLALMQNYLQNIKNIRFNDKSGNLLITINISHKTINEELNISESMIFIKEHKNILENFVKHEALYINEKPAQIGFYIYASKDNIYVCEKVLAILDEEPKKEICINIPFAANYVYHTKSLYSKIYGLFFTLKEIINMYIKEDACYIPNLGYYQIKKNIINLKKWEQINSKNIFTGEQCIGLKKLNYYPFSDIAPVWIDEKIHSMEIIDNFKIQKIRILDYDKGWFYIDPKYKITDNQKLNLSIEKLMKYTNTPNAEYIYENNVWIKVPETVKDIFSKTDDNNKIKLNIFDIFKLSATSGFRKFIASHTILQNLKDKVVFDVQKTNLPNLKHTNLKLRDYQIYGVKWLWWLYINNFNGLLADEMGLGKTHQAMGLLSCIQTQIPNPKFLIICPTTVLNHWYDKIKEFCPNLNAMIYHGMHRKAVDISNTPNNTIITSYNLLIKDNHILNKIQWDALIIDEVQFVKNDKTKTYKSILELSAKIKIMLSGTPIENNLKELKNIFDILIPGYFGTNKNFSKKFLKPIERGDWPIQRQLQQLISPFKLRRVKSQVLKDLPEKIEDIKRCELLDEQIELYNAIISTQVNPLIKLLKESPQIPYMHVFAVITKLKQVCDHPCLIYQTSDINKHMSGKFELLKELIEEALGSNHKIVIYSQYVQMLTLISKYLNIKKINHVVLTGETHNRAEVINEFQNNPDVKIFCGSLLAGGIGIDLTAASVVIHYDRWWNPSKENQATDRVHRIGQNKNVLVLKLMTTGTLEEKIDYIINKKKDMFDNFISQDEDTIKKLTKEDIIYLLS